VRRVPYALACFGTDEREAVLEVLDQEMLNPGARVKEFEQKIANIFGKTYGCMVNSGSSANLLALYSQHFPPHSEVITPVLTFATTVAPIVQLGLTPVFVDVSLIDYQIDLNQLTKAITRNTVALMIPNLLGNMTNLEELRSIADEHNLIYIQDSCDTIGAKFNGKPTGVYADFVTTSFYGSHVITCAGGGGMVMTDDEGVYRRLLMLRGWGRSSALNETEDISERFQAKLVGIPYDSKFLYEEIGFNFQPIEIQAAFGLAQLTKLDMFMQRRKYIYDELYGRLRENGSILLPHRSISVDTNWIAFPMILLDGNKKALVTHLEENGIQTRPIFSGTITRQPAYESFKWLRYYPVSDMITERGFLVGAHQSMCIADVEYIVDQINGWTSHL
jgi:CDP-4-dehydro-6-deoxyglucose reductase, E1